MKTGSEGRAGVRASAANQDVSFVEMKWESIVIKRPTNGDGAKGFCPEINRPVDRSSSSSPPRWLSRLENAANPERKWRVSGATPVPIWHDAVDDTYFYRLTLAFVISLTACVHI